MIDDLGFLPPRRRTCGTSSSSSFAASGHSKVRPSHGSVLVPLFEEDGLRMGELARRARLSKQTMTGAARSLEREGPAERRADPADGRAIFLTAQSRSSSRQPPSFSDELDRLVRGQIGEERD